MYWSVVGIYCAFCAEVLTRASRLLGLRDSWGLFSLLVGVSIFIVMLIATLIFKKYKPIWKNQFRAKIFTNTPLKTLKSVVQTNNSSL